MTEGFGEIKFGDVRLDKRFFKTVEELGKRGKGSILSSTGDRNSARGFYRLLENDKVTLEIIRDSAQKATFEKISAVRGRVLLI